MSLKISPIDGRDNDERTHFTKKPETCDRKWSVAQCEPSGGRDNCNYNLPLSCWAEGLVSCWGNAPRIEVCIGKWKDLKFTITAQARSNWAPRWTSLGKPRRERMAGVGGGAEGGEKDYTYKL